jgi:hypothetical protein
MDANDSTGYVGNFDNLHFGRLISATPLPFRGTPFVPNQTIEAEDYDTGGEGFSYHDTDAPNVGGAYRLGGGVDVEANPGGFNVGYAVAGEYLSYSLNVPQAGTFALQARVASLRAGGRFQLEVDGRNVATFDVPATGGWQTYVTLNSPKNVALAAGKHTLRLVMERNNTLGYVANFDWLKVVS